MNIKEATLRPLTTKSGSIGSFHSLEALEVLDIGTNISRLPFTLRVVLESQLRNVDEQAVTSEHVRQLANWQPTAVRNTEVPFVVNRLVAPDASGIPLLADLAAMREAALALGRDAGRIEPQVNIDLIVDHSLQVEQAGSAQALAFNMKEEFRQNGERYAFLKWAAGAFNGLRIVPPGVGIIHQVNIEKLASGVASKGGVYFPDSVVGTDSHTCMINGVGILGWGIGGIEAESVMLGQPLYFLMPDVVGVELTGAPRPGVTTTDIVLSITERLRAAKVVGKFVEFIGPGAASLAASDRCTIANMAPEYGATAGFFAVDEKTISFMRATGRPQEQLDAMRAYYQAQGMFGIPASSDIDYSEVISFDLSAVVPSVSGPRRPQDRIALAELKATIDRLTVAPKSEGGFGLKEAVVPAEGAENAELTHHKVVLAAITSCSNTSNPSVLLAAGLLAKNAVERGLTVPGYVKTSFTPGSRVVQAYLAETGLQPYLDQLGFHIVGFGCATCMGSSGPLNPGVEDAIVRDELVAAAVLSGNRNFEARIHSAVKSNYLMSPPLVVAFAIAGRVDIDTATEPLGHDADGKPVYLADIWPDVAEIEALLPCAYDPAHFQHQYAGFTEGNELWQQIDAAKGASFPWDEKSTYLRCPPFFEGVSLTLPESLPSLKGARPLVILGDSVTTDHVSPGSVIPAGSTAGNYLQSWGVPKSDFNTYVARRTNHEVMMRGTFGSVRLRNLMVPGVEGDVTVYQPAAEIMSIYQAAMQYRQDGVPLLVIAGNEYGTGSSRDWAAKGPALLGVRAVIANSFERIHRSNLAGMGILPCQLVRRTASELQLDGSEVFDIKGLDGDIRPQMELTLVIKRQDGTTDEVPMRARLDTEMEIAYYRHGGILPYLLRKLLADSVVANKEPA